MTESLCVDTSDLNRGLERDSTYAAAYMYLILIAVRQGDARRVFELARLANKHRDRLTDEGRATLDRILKRVPSGD